MYLLTGFLKAWNCWETEAASYAVYLLSSGEHYEQLINARGIRASCQAVINPVKEASG